MERIHPGHVHSNISVMVVTILNHFLENFKLWIKIRKENFTWITSRFFDLYREIIW